MKIDLKIFYLAQNNLVFVKKCFMRLKIYRKWVTRLKIVRKHFTRRKTIFVAYPIEFLRKMLYITDVLRDFWHHIIKKHRYYYRVNVDWTIDRTIDAILKEMVA